MNTAIKLIKTNDGLVGIDIGPMFEVIWMNTPDLAKEVVLAHYDKPNCYSQEKIAREFDLALRVMKETNSDIAIFGIAGSFMYPKKSQEDKEF